MIIKFLAGLLLLTSVAEAATYTVCASSCDYTSPQSAVNAASRGDTIRLKAETFTELLVLPKKSTGTGYVTLEAYDLAKLPPVGTRVTPAYSVYMPKLQSTNAADAAIRVGNYEYYPDTWDMSTDSVNMGSGISNGDPIACWNDDGVIPLVKNRIYYARDVSGSTIKFAATPGGAVVDLVTTPTATRFRCTLVDVGSWYRLRGIEIAAREDVDTLFTLAEFGTGNATAREGLPHHIILDRVYIHGQPTKDGPRLCVSINAGHFTMTDSYISECKQLAAEGKALAGWQTPGPTLIRNNHIEGASINMLWGGEYVRIENLVNGDSGATNVTGNYFYKPTKWKRTTGVISSTVPVGDCAQYSSILSTVTGVAYSCPLSSWTAVACADNEYFNITNVTQNCASQACWKCLNGVYVPSTELRQSNYAVKNNFESKSITGLNFSGNVAENNWNGNGDQQGYAFYFASVVGQGEANGWVVVERSNFSKNKIINSPLGARIGTDGSTVFGRRNNRLVMNNNLGIGIGETYLPSLTAWSGTALSMAGPCDDCEWNHNTMAPGISSNTGAGWGLQFDTEQFDRTLFANNLTQANGYGLRTDSDSDCSGLVNGGLLGPGSSFVNNTMIYNQYSSTPTSIGACATNTRYENGPWTTHLVDYNNKNYRLKTTSPFSASCVSGCIYAGSDGKDLGADVDLVETATGGAATGAPWLGSSVRIDAGSSRAVVKYTAPSLSTCTLRLYTDVARTTLHSDTSDSGKQMDSRSGNVTSGTSRYFVLGTNTALTPSTQYQAVIACGPSVAFSPVRTRASGSGTYTTTVRYSSATTGEYSASATMSSPVAISTSTNHSIPISSGAVAYYRKRNGYIQALVAP